MKLGKVEKQSFFYAALKIYGRFVHDFFFYKRVTYIGTDNIPKGKPVLIAPNHQNALMDALAIIFAQKIQPVFLARSDIFKNPIIARILYSFKILPVFRIRDGKEKLKLNDTIYNKTIEVLEKHRQVVIFPEAQHINKKHVRQLKKGIQRIAFMLEHKHNFEADVQIIPTGIYYSNYWNFRSKLVVKFGKPLNIKEYKDDYFADPAKTIVNFTEVLHQKITQEAIHIKDLEVHDDYDLLRDVNEETVLKELNLEKSPENKLLADKETIKKADNLKGTNPKKFEELINDLKAYAAGLKAFKLKDRIIKNHQKNNRIGLRILLLITGLPFFIYGFLNNVIVYFLPGIITKKLKDRQFESSIVYGFSIFLYPIIYILQSVPVFIFFNWYIGLAYVISTPFFGLLAFLIHRQFVKTSALLRFLKNKESVSMNKLISLRTKIAETLKS